MSELTRNRSTKFPKHYGGPQAAIVAPKPRVRRRAYDPARIRATIVLQALRYSDTGFCNQLALNSLAGYERIPAATHRGKNDTQLYIYDLGPGEARATKGL